MPLSRMQMIALAAALLFAASSAAAQDAGGFYKGKTIRLIVGFTPGGGTDANARLLARYYGSHIPGNPNIIVENMPGASSLKSVQYLDGAAKDGTVITMPSAGLIAQSQTDPIKFPIKLTNYSWIGSSSEEVRVCYTWSAKGILTWNDLKQAKEVVFGETGAGSSGYIDERMLATIFGINLKQVLGYPGAAEKHLALERGELDGDCGTFGDINDEWIHDKKVSIVLRFSTHLLPGIPADAPYFIDLVGSPEQKQVLKLLSVPGEIGRAYIVSKDVPADRLRALRSAFDATLADPLFLADAQKEGLTVIGPLTGEAAQDYVADLYRSPPEVISAARAISGD